VVLTKALIVSAVMLGIVAGEKEAREPSDIRPSKPVVIERGGAYVGHRRPTGSMPAPLPSTAQLPATITTGGTYSGTRTGTVSIRTAQPVVIENSTITNTGTGFLIDANVAGVQLTVRRTTLNGGTGQAIYAVGYRSITVEQSTINKTWGIRLDRAQSGATVRLTRNKFLNQTFDQATNGNGFWWAHSVQIADSGANHASCEIDWNQFVNEFGQSWVEDVISIYRSSGCRIHDNGIRGAYPPAVSTGYSGSGIMIDASGANNEVYSNQVIDTTNAGIGIFGGFGNKAYDNRLVSDGRLSTGEMLAAANVGLFVWNGSNDPSWGDNQAYRNSVGWISAKKGGRNDWWLPHCSRSCGNVRFTGRIRDVNEVAEWVRWGFKLQASKVKVGR
jgi:hypothetical protein